jgi:hypothetical protein
MFGQWDTDRPITHCTSVKYAIGNSSNHTMAHRPDQRRNVSGNLFAAWHGHLNPWLQNFKFKPSVIWRYSDAEPRKSVPKSA